MALVQPGMNLRERIKQHVMFEFGHGVVTVEVLEPWIDQAIDLAIQEFSRFAPNADEWVVFNTTAGVNKYRVDENYLFVRRVVYQPQLNVYGYYNMFSAFGAWGPWMQWFRNMSLTDYAITDMYISQTRRTLGLQGTWNFDHPYLYLYPTPPSSVPVFVKVTKLLDYENGSRDIREESWVRDYATAIMKIRLGRVRSKYASLPGPRGDISMDGSSLISEGREDLERLRNDARKEYEEPLGFYTDSYFG